MFAALGRFIYTRRWYVLAAGLVFLIASAIFGTSLFGVVKGGGFYDPNSESIQVAQGMHDKLGRDDGALVVLFTSKDGAKVDDPQYKQAVEATLAKVEGKQGVGKITSFYNTGAAPLVSNDRLSTYAIVGMTGEQQTQEKNLDALRPLLTNDRLQVRLGGVAAMSQEITEQVQKDLAKAETLTFPILAILLIFIFGSLVAASLPLAVGGLTILGSFLILRILANFTDINIFSINIITMLGLGLAIDYGLFILSRFREELARQDGDGQAALARTMQTAGRTVVFSGLTVMISMLSLLVFPMMFLQSMGLGGAVAVLVAMLMALTVLPAMLAILGKRINSLSVTSLFRRRGARAQDNTSSPQAQEARATFWYRMSHFVMRHPAIVLVVTLVPMLIVGTPFLQVQFATADARSLPAGRDSRVVAEMLSSNFPRNETEPIDVLVTSDKAAVDAASVGVLYDYTRQLAKLPGVRRVDSLVNLDPRLDKTAYVGFYSEAGRAANPQAAQAAAQFSKDNHTLVSVLYDSDPLSNASQDLVREVRSQNLPAGLISAQVGGDSAYMTDFLASLGKSLPWALGLIVFAVFVLLFLMLGSVVVPFKAVVLNILSLSVSFGALVWLFQQGHFHELLNFTPLGSIEPSQPVLIFAIAFGLSMDYEVFLLSRIKEHYDRTKDTTASVAMGVQKTGAIITSAALLLVIVIGGFATGEVLFVKMVGVGLALAILVDATIVRMLLVPATMRMLGKYNWWAPKPLARLYNRLNLGETEEAEPTAASPSERAAQPAG